MEVFEVTTRAAEVELEYDLVGDGELVVLLHARPFVSWYAPLVDALSGWSVLRYRRTVRAQSGTFGIDDDAEAVCALLRHVRPGRAHLVGHSYGGLVALAVAMRDRSTVGSLALLEPASLGFMPPSDAEAAIAPLIATYRMNGPEDAVDQFLRLVCGDGYRPALDRAVPAAFDDAVAHATQFFDVELPAVAGWTCAPGDVGTIAAPVLNAVGGKSSPRFAQGADLIQRWLPHAQRLTFADTNHLLIAERPQQVAKGLTPFWRDGRITPR